MIKKLGLVALSILALGVAGHAMADTHYDGFTTLNADGLPAGGINTDWKWADVEASNGYWGGGCASMNKMMGSNIPCTIDHASWQAFYKEELTRPNKIDRVSSHPGQFCGTSGLYFFSENSAITQNDFQVCANDAACKADFLSKVKAVNCVVKAEDKEPSVTLENGVMTFNITRKPNGDTPNGDGWVKAEAFRLFPLYAKLRGQ